MDPIYANVEFWNAFKQDFVIVPFKIKGLECDNMNDRQFMRYMKFYDLIPKFKKFINQFTSKSFHIISNHKITRNKLLLLYTNNHDDNIPYPDVDYDKYEVVEHIKYFSKYEIYRELYIDLYSNLHFFRLMLLVILRANDSSDNTYKIYEEDIATLRELYNERLNSIGMNIIDNVKRLKKYFYTEKSDYDIFMKTKIMNIYDSYIPYIKMKDNIL